MSFNYDRYSRQQRTVRSGTSSSGSASYIPLILTISAATVGLAGWIWSQRRDEDDDYNYYYDSSEEDDRRKVQRKREGDGPPGPENPPSFREEPRPGESSYVDVQRDSSTTEWREQDEEEAQGIVARMSGAIRRTPSPQQMFDTTRKSVVAGVAAASAAVGKGLSAITEEDKDEGFNDHETWSEEAETRESTVVPDTAAAATAAAAGAAMSGSMVSSGSRGIQPQSGVRGRRKTVAIVISAEGDFSGRAPEGDSYNLEHASILTHLSNSINSETTNVLVLIYAPYLSKHPLANSTPTDTRPPRDLSNASSYSNISTPTPADPAGAEGDVIQQYSTDEAGTLYAAMAEQAQRLVSHPTNIMPFTTANGHIHMLRHLSPNVVYIQESLCGNGAVIKEITGWTGQVVIVLGAEGAGGGLIDTETEDEGADKKDERKFWMDESIVGLGKADVVDGEKIAEDWAKRIGN